MYISRNIGMIFKGNSRSSTMVSVAYDFLSVVICSNHISVLHLLRDIKTCLSIKNLMLQKMTVKIPLVLLRQLQKIYKKV